MSWNNQDLSSPVITDKAVVALQNKVLDKTNTTADSIAQHFSQFLKPQVALNQALKEEAFKIRHNVYCEELAFEQVNPSGQERDEFDSRSLYSLIKHKPSGNFTSCVRVVTTSSQSELLPIEKYCMGAITNEALSPPQFNRKKIAEISRLAVKSEFRRRKTDSSPCSNITPFSATAYSEIELRCFPFIAIGLYISAAVMSREFGIQHVYVMMEPRLARSMRFLGITFQQLGEPINYHGLRAPYYIQPETFIKDISPNLRELFKVIESDLCTQLKTPLNLTLT